jgi:GT2 family glycosyltransferase
MTAISVAIVNHNTREHLRRCLATVREVAACRVVVVDNASSDGSVAMVRADFPEVELRAQPDNPGYGAAANRAIAGCGTPYVLLLNSDTLLQSGALPALAAYLDAHPAVAILGPRLANPDGTLQVSCYPWPSPLDFFLEVSYLDRLARYVPPLRRRYLRTWAHDEPRAVPWVMGAALAFRRAPFDAVGGFDETFYMYAEEIDLAYRLHAAGWQIHFAPVTTVVHAGAASTIQRRADMQVQWFASMIRFYRRHYSRRRVAAIVALMRAIAGARLLRDLVRLRFARDRELRATLGDQAAAWRRVLLAHW